MIRAVLQGLIEGSKLLALAFFLITATPVAMTFDSGTAAAVSPEEKSAELVLAPLQVRRSPRP